ncbi:MAG: hypothetical protein IJZ66_03830 [Oscillibacter sp.]|nr:hypothetical protein [Oscillibacter sp.]
MNLLVDALYAYAQEHRLCAYLHPEQEEIADTRRMLDHSLAQLKAMGAKAADYTGNLEYGFLVLADIYERANFLAGLSIGLELSRLGQGT